MPPQTSLLQNILKEVKKTRYSPLNWHRTTKAIARGDVDQADARDIAHALFDWYIEIPEENLSDTDSALLDIDPETISDPTERKQALRRQRKALKRAAAKNKTQTTKVCPPLITLVEILLQQTPVAAADKLAYLSVNARDLTVNEIVDLATRITPVKSSYMPQATPNELADNLKTLDEYKINDPLSTRTYVYVAAHAQQNRTETEMRATLVPAGTGYSNTEYQAIVEKTATGTLTVKEQKKALATTLNLDDLVEYAVIKKPSAAQQKLFAYSNIPYIFKPVINYTSTIENLQNLLEWDQRHRAGLAPAATIDEIITIRNNQTEFAVPRDAVLENYQMGDCTVTTFTDSKTLQANGQHMGNCTNTYKSTYKAGGRILFKVIHNGATYNTDINLTINNNGKATATCRETKGRYNHQAPQVIQENARQLAALVKEAAEKDPEFKTRNRT